MILHTCSQCPGPLIRWEGAGQPMPKNNARQASACGPWQGARAVPDGARSALPRATPQRLRRGEERLRTTWGAQDICQSVLKYFKMFNSQWGWTCASSLNTSRRLEILYCLPSFSSLRAWLKIEFKVTSEANPGEEGAEGREPQVAPSGSQSSIRAWIPRMTMPCFWICLSSRL